MEFFTKVKALLTLMTESAKAQTIILSTLGVLGIGGLGIGGFTLYEHYYGPEAAVSAEVNTENSPTEKEELVAVATEVTEEIEVTETETETETETGPILVKLIGSSIEKDLKIKIQNEEQRNVKDEEFCIIVTPDKKNATSSVYNDHDNDGIIYITDIAGGDYLVALEEIEGYYTDEESIKVTVKEQIEYVKVEVKDEIKKEEEVSPEEDAQGKTDKVDKEDPTPDNSTPPAEPVVESTPVAASTIDKTQYQIGKASVIESHEPVTVPKEEATLTASVSFRNLFYVRTGTNEVIKTVPNETITNTEDSTDTGSSENPGSTEGTGSPENPGSTEGTGSSGNPGNTEDTGSSQKPDSTEKPESTQKPDSTEKPESTQKPEGTQPSTPAPTATVTMPKTAQLFISSRNTANTLELTVSVEDKNGIVQVNDIAWKIEKDTTSDGSTGLKVDGESRGAKIKISSANSKKAGTAIVVATIPYEVNGKKDSVELKCEVTVSEDTYDTTIALKDSTGDALYKDKECKNPATVADLIGGNVTTFYKNPKYKDTIGIDVSKYQKNIDWNAVKAAGVEFVIIRVGYRGSSTGVLVEDPYFKQNIQGATKAGLKVGIYFFTQAITKAEAVEEASMALALTEGYNLAYPIFIDTERVSGNARANNLDKATRTEIVDAFCQTIQNAGKKAGVYASKSWYNNQLNTSKLEKYCIWVAQYNTECNYKGRYDIWQYSEKGQIPGISTYVDMNISYMN